MLILIYTTEKVISNIEKPKTPQRADHGRLLSLGSTLALTWVLALAPAFAAPLTPFVGSKISAYAPITNTNTRLTLHLLSAVAMGPSEPGDWPLS